MRSPRSPRRSSIDYRQVFGAESLVCPWHEDTEPSLHIYSDHIYCFGCRRRYSPVDLLVETRDMTSQEAFRYLRSFRGFHPGQWTQGVDRTPVDTNNVLSWHDKLMANTVSQVWLFQRGVSASLLVDLYLGLKEGRFYTIPHFVDGQVENVKFRVHPDYAMDGDRRYDCVRHKSFSQLYPYDFFIRTWAGRTKTLFITEGEFDAMVLLGSDIPAVSIPRGVAWDLRPWAKFLRPFEHIVLLYDMDKGGERAAARACEEMPRPLGKKITRETWPAEWGKDVTDARHQLIPRLWSQYGRA